MAHPIDKNRSFILLISVLLLIFHKTRVNNSFTKNDFLFYFNYIKFLHFIPLPYFIIMLLNIKFNFKYETTNFSLNNFKH